MGFGVWPVPGKACDEHIQQGGELCGGQAGPTVRRQRFLPVRVWLVVGYFFHHHTWRQDSGVVIFYMVRWLGRYTPNG